MEQPLTMTLANSYFKTRVYIKIIALKAGTSALVHFLHQDSFCC